MQIGGLFQGPLHMQILKNEEIQAISMSFILFSMSSFSRLKWVNYRLGVATLCIFLEVEFEQQP